jgi:hypothetical protein
MKSVCLFLVAFGLSTSALSQTKQLQDGVLKCALIDYSQKLPDRTVTSSVEFSLRDILKTIDKEKLSKNGAACNALIQGAYQGTVGRIYVTVTNPQGISAQSATDYNFDDKIKEPNVSVLLGNFGCSCHVIKQNE